MYIFWSCFSPWNSCIEPCFGLWWDHFWQQTKVAPPHSKPWKHMVISWSKTCLKKSRWFSCASWAMFHYGLWVDLTFPVCLFTYYLLHTYILISCDAYSFNLKEALTTKFIDTYMHEIQSSVIFATVFLVLCIINIVNSTALCTNCLLHFHMWL